MRLRLAIASVLVLLTTACATTPLAIRQPPPGNVQLTQVLPDPKAYIGTRVRWGGAIASTENRPGQTWIEVIEFKLTSGGEPRPYSRSDGRFFIRVDKFLDPAIYVKNGLITVAGLLSGETKGTIGQQPYTYPVVHAQDLYLWTPAAPGYAYPPYPYPYYWSYYPYYPYYYCDPFYCYPYGYPYFGLQVRPAPVRPRNQPPHQ